MMDTETVTISVSELKHLRAIEAKLKEIDIRKKEEHAANVSEEELARLRKLDELTKARLAKWHEAGKRFLAENKEKARELSRVNRRRHYEKVKQDPERWAEIRFQDNLSRAKKRLEETGGLTKRTQKEIIDALQLVWDTDSDRWVKPN